MARETKVGLIVATSFLLVVGGVLGYKFYFGGEPLQLAGNGDGPEKPDDADGEKAQRQPAIEEPKPITHVRIAAPANDGWQPVPSSRAKGEHQQVAYVESEEGKADRELFDSFAEATLEQLYAAGQASVQNLRALRGLIVEPRPAMASASSDRQDRGAPPPPALDRQERTEKEEGIEAPTPPDVGSPLTLRPRAAARGSARMEKDADNEERKIDAAELPSLENRPRLGDQVRERGQPEPPPALPFQPPTVVVEEPRPSRPPAVAAPLIEEPRSRLPERRPAGARLPMDFDRAYEPPALGKPTSGRASEPATPTSLSNPNNPARVEPGREPEEKHPPGIPVTLQQLPPEALASARPQGAVRPQTGNIQAPATAADSRGDSFTPQGVRPRMVQEASGQAPANLAPRVDMVVPRVESFDVETYYPRQGDTYAGISQAKYQSDAYQHALAAFNRERDPSLATVQPGRPVRIPPRDYLERNYRQLIGVGSATAVADVNRNGSNLAAPPCARSPKGSVEPDAATAPARFNPAPAANARATNRSDWSGDAVAGEKQYHVRQEDVNRPAPLWDIARRTLGNGERWSEIARLNKDRLRDVNQLTAGMTLRLPADAKVDAAETPP